LPITVVVAITIAITMSKLKKPVYPKFDTQTKELHKRIAAAINALPPKHLTRPKAGELFADPEDAFICIHNWGFTQGILLIKESTNNKRGRWQIDCSRHHKETAN
jgi:hypothetical protein